jgi:hypothetical protein
MNFLGKPLDCQSAWKLYDRGLSYNAQLNLDDTVQTNENFFIGKQWEGVEANGLPTPQMNFIKRVVCFVVATITTDNLAIQATILPSTPGKKQLRRQVGIVNNEFQALLEMNRVAKLLRSFARDAAVRGDACMYTYFDAEAETGQDAKGAIRTELIKNNRVFFGNPNSHDVQSQPYILIEQQLMERDAQQEAKRNGNADWEHIRAGDDNHGVDSAKKTDGKVTAVTLLWRDEETKEIWAYRFTQHGFLREPWCLGIRRYPIVWMSWDNVDDCYHGQSMIAGIIPNQIFVNKSWAMAMVSIMKMAFPKYIYDSTRVKGIDNRVGAAIPINGGDVTNAVKSIDPPAISPQVYQFMESAVTQTQENLGATAVALGDTRPDNTSAIIALQRAAATPSELTKLSLYDCVEDLFRIYLEFMVNYYGVRYIDVETSDEEREAMRFANLPVEDEVTIPFDFATLKDSPMLLKMEAGASSYYSEIASINTLDNLLMQGKITPTQYLKRIPDGYIPDRRGLIAEMETDAMNQAAAAPQPAAQQGGYASMQRKINEGVA